MNLKVILIPLSCMLTFLIPVAIARRWKDGDIRLVGGGRKYRGTVLIYRKRRWGAICDSLWGLNDAMVACKQLGFAGALYAPTRSKYGPGRRRKWLTRIRCSGKEEGLLKCPFDLMRSVGRHKCRGLSRSAGVVCTRHKTSRAIRHVRQRPARYRQPSTSRPTTTTTTPTTTTPTTTTSTTTTTTITTTTPTTTTPTTTTTTTPTTTTTTTTTTTPETTTKHIMSDLEEEIAVWASNGTHNETSIELADEDLIKDHEKTKSDAPMETIGYDLDLGSSPADMQEKENIVLVEKTGDTLKEAKEDQEAKEDKEDKEAKEDKEDKKAKEVKEDKEAKEVKEDKEAKEAKEDKKAKEAEEAKEDKKAKEAEEAKEDKKAKEAKEAEEAKEDKKAKEAKEAEEAKEDKKAKEAKEAKHEELPVLSDEPLDKDLEIRLLGGRYKWEGRLEVREKEDKWGVICSDHWTMREVMVACNQLGNIGMAKQVLTTSYFGGSRVKKHYYRIDCQGREDNLGKCNLTKIDDEHKCSRNTNVAGVVCSNHLPDLVPHLKALEISARLQDQPLYYLRCAMEENCLAKSAYVLKETDLRWRNNMRRLLRFSTVVHNSGNADFRPYRGKNQWEWHSCHMHFHSMEIFAHYDLMDEDGNRLAEGSKASFCLEDTVCDKGISPKYNCQGLSAQGLSVNCSDNYMYDIDCQWIDVTDLKPGYYTFLLEVNPSFLVAESNFDNNVVSCQMYYNGYYAHIRHCEHQSLLDFRQPRSQKEP